MRVRYLDLLTTTRTNVAYLEVTPMVDSFHQFRWVVAIFSMATEVKCSHLRQCAYCDGCQIVLEGRLYISRIGRGALLERLIRERRKVRPKSQ